MSAFRLRRRDRTESESQPADSVPTEPSPADDPEIADAAVADGADIPAVAPSAGGSADGGGDANGPIDDADAVRSVDDGDGSVDARGSDVEGEGEWLAYELHEWALEDRVMLQQLLTVDQVVHSWQGTTLLVHESLEDDVDKLIDEVEEAREAISGQLSDDEELTAYEIGDWPPELRAELVRRLQEARIPHMIDMSGGDESDDEESDKAVGGDESDEDGLVADEPVYDGAAAADEPVDDGAAAADEPVDDGAAAADEPVDDGASSGCDLLVRETDEQRVELVIDDLMAQAEAADLEELEGLEANDLLSALFVACDRLRREPRDVEGAGSLAATGQRLNEVRAPFGFSASNWRSLQKSVNALLDMIADTESEGEDVREAAGRMSSSLRSLI